MADAQALQVYADAGYHLTPLNGKIPIRKDWPNSVFSAKPNLDNFPANFGIVLQNTDLVVDCDPRNYKDSINSLQKLQADINWKIKGTFTTVVRTGGGGFHIYLKKPKDLQISTHHPDYPGVEFKTKGSQVVGARSVHPETKMFYNIVQGCFALPIPEAPKALLDLIARKSQTTVTENNLTAVPETPVVAQDVQAKQRFQEHCKTTPAALEGDAGDRTTYSVACFGRDLGLTQGDTTAIMLEVFNPRCGPPWSRDELAKKVINAYAYAQNTQGVRHPSSDFSEVKKTEPGVHWDLNAEGLPKRTLNNCVNYFLKHDERLTGILAWDEFTDQVMIVEAPPWHPHEKIPKDGLPWSNEDATLCRYYLSRERKFDIPPNVLAEAVVVAAKKNPNHPVRNYLNDLKWDHVPRIDTWLCDYCGTPDSDYARVVGAKTLLGAVARVFQPGIKFDYMLVLEGAQGTGKSSIVAALGGPWYGDLVINPHDKDTIAAMRGKWIVEASEMDFTTKAEAQAQKAFLSRQVDVCRFAYDRLARAVPRQCIIIGTMNLDLGGGYLKDTTGNRRFWPVETQKMRLKELRDARDQLFSEALFRYKNGESLYIEDRKVAQMAFIEQHARRLVDPWAEIIVEWVEKDAFDKPRNLVNVKDIWISCLNGLEKQLDRRAHMRIVNVLKNELKWDQGTYWFPDAKKPCSGFKRPAFTPLPAPDLNASGILDE